MKRRFLSTLMALCLALSLIPTAAYATGDEGTDITPTETDVTTPVTDPESTGEETPSEETTGEIMDASALLQAVESAEDATELTLGADITLGNGLAISNNKVITLDLNGKTLDAGANVISVTNGSELTIEDRSNGAAGKIRAQNQIEVESASLVLNSGAIEITGTSGQSYGVFVSEGGSAIVNGGTITSNYAPLGGNNTTGDMNFEVHGGTLTAKNGPAIYMPGQVKLDITGLRQRGLPLYPTMLYALARSVNRHEEFRTAFDGEGRLGIYDRLEPSYTVFHKDSQTFSCLWTEYQEDYAAFCRAYQADLDAYGSAEGFEGKPNTPPNVFNVSMIPWESFDSFHLHCPQGNSYLLPIFTIGRFYREGDRVLLPLAAQVHHAVCDGFHLCRLIGEVRAWLADGGPAAGGQPGREGAEK